MDRSPNIDLQEIQNAREDLTASRYNSTDSITNAAIQHTIETKFRLPDTEYTSFSPPSRTTSYKGNSTALYETTAEKPYTTETEYARYTHAPPPYTEKEYAGKSEGQQNIMRSQDYAKEISRLMGHQLVKGLKSSETERELMNEIVTPDIIKFQDVI